MTTSNPGSDEAIKQGCRCPVIDNGHGKGYYDGHFVIDIDCPLHGLKGGAIQFKIGNLNE